jgi:serine protease Do
MVLTQPFPKNAAMSGPMKIRLPAKTKIYRLSSWLAVGLFAAGSSTANAQQAPFPPRGTEQIPISVRKPTDFYSSQSRDEQYAQISQEVEILERQQSLLRRVVRLVSPTVVHIEAVKEEQAPESGTFKSASPKRIEEAGSGFVARISQSTVILTNRHVVHGAPLHSIRIETSDGGIINPRRVLEDPSTDIAVLDIDGVDLPSARTADSREVAIGDYVFAVGSPFGLNHSVSYGIVSAKGRRNLELGSKQIVFQDFIQTDAAINPGNSGGPLMNLRGEVVGINTAIASNSGGSEGIGFAIPINIAMNVAQQLVERGGIQRSYLGVSVDPVFNNPTRSAPGAPRPKGAFVKVVRPNSPAEQVGMKYGDVILEFDGNVVDNDEHLVQLVGLTAMDRPIEVVFLREGQQYKLNVTLVPLSSAQK